MVADLGDERKPEAAARGSSRQLKDGDATPSDCLLRSPASRAPKSLPARNRFGRCSFSNSRRAPSISPLRSPWWGSPPLRSRLAAKPSTCGRKQHPDSEVAFVGHFPLPVGASRLNACVFVFRDVAFAILLPWWRTIDPRSQLEDGRLFQNSGVSTRSRMRRAWQVQGDRGVDVVGTLLRREACSSSTEAP
jgi:hypothetical protein